MKLVRELINEIKKDSSSSALSRIKVGSASMHKAYEDIRKMDTNLFYRKKHPNEMASHVKKALEIVSALFDTDQTNITVYSVESLNVPIVEYVWNIIKDDSDMAEFTEVDGIKITYSIELGLAYAYATYGDDYDKAHIYLRTPQQ